MELRRALASAVGDSAADLVPETIRLRARKPMTQPKPVSQPLREVPGADARMGRRCVSWGSRGGTAQILRWESLQPGDAVAGPAVLEGEQTTYFISEGWAMTLDSMGNGAVRLGGQSAVHDVSSTRKAYGDAAA
jgi:N-methylhydantoinase A/oxoprolinase/acetone carboxylase beta subunit